MRASTPPGKHGRTTKRGALAILDEVLLDALRALLAEHPALEDPRNITAPENLPITSVAERVVDRIMELRDLLEHYQATLREPHRQSAAPNEDDILF